MTKALDEITGQFFLEYAVDEHDQHMLISKIQQLVDKAVIDEWKLCAIWAKANGRPELERYALDVLALKEKGLL